MSAPKKKSNNLRRVIGLGLLLFGCLFYFYFFTSRNICETKIEFSPSVKENMLEIVEKTKPVLAEMSCSEEIKHEYLKTIEWYLKARESVIGATNGEYFVQSLEKHIDSINRGSPKVYSEADKAYVDACYRNSLIGLMYWLNSLNLKDAPANQSAVFNRRDFARLTDDARLVVKLGAEYDRRGYERGQAEDEAIRERDRLEMQKVMEKARAEDPDNYPPKPENPDVF